jgi:anti-sigma B factor antagonist
MDDLTPNGEPSMPNGEPSMPDGEADLRVELGSSTDGTPIAAVRGDLDLGTVDQLEHAIASVLEQEPDALILDLSKVGFADSSAIAKLIQWSHRVGDLQVHGASPLLRRVISTMGLSGRLRLT